MDHRETACFFDCVKYTWPLLALVGGHDFT